jgi:hypothetical protein
MLRFPISGCTFFLSSDKLFLYCILQDDKLRGQS